jgi:hypothetical protein
MIVFPASIAVLTQPRQKTMSLLFDNSFVELLTRWKNKGKDLPLKAKNFTGGVQ